METEHEVLGIKVGDIVHLEDDVFGIIVGIKYDIVYTYWFDKERILESSIENALRWREKLERLKL